MIWKHVYQESRWLQVGIDCGFSHAFVSDLPVPALLHTNSEPRTVGLKNYFCLKTPKQQIGITYINFKTDILCLLEKWFQVSLGHKSLPLEKIERLAVSSWWIQLQNNNVDDVIRGRDRMHNLREFFSVVGINFQEIEEDALYEVDSEAETRAYPSNLRRMKFKNRTWKVDHVDVVRLKLMKGCKTKDTTTKLAELADQLKGKTGISMREFRTR